MRVFHAPVFEANAFQELLFDALQERGVETTVERQAMPFTPFAHRLRDADALHLHWLHPYFLFGSIEWVYWLPFSWLICWLAALVFVGQVALAERHVHVVWTAHNLVNHERRYERIDRWVTGQVVRRADAVQVWDDRTRTELCDRFDVEKEKVVAIPHGNYCERYEAEDRTMARKELDLQDDERVYLTFGVIRPYKGVADLVRAFEGVDGRLIVAGNPKYGKLERELKTLTAGRDDVRLDLGYVPDESVPTYFAAADLAVFPYRDIYNSGSVILAMSLGRPVVAPSKGSIPSVLPSGNVVYEDLPAGLRRADAKTDSELRAVGERNRETARIDHAWNDIAQRIEGLYRGTSREGN
ncbi:glycosyltransferase family 4 protein [Halanaeroarchaeum sulfurireducens]|uniref:Group 1 glycosyl transferase n=1 Tax=Halanaeroarchaeum sulfurireducens TaxID=1604004 RepID=A0A0F7PBD3_9EURY|nr:glycosyltransferase family 4 protein [Halanaeroarchaeum sulfurireducens]AKH98002.1 group 1 glycosyl transferase [Halanaeroarchaeum sulfurireducens]ALG82396.1 group 1 glycosyl transferase [Halanaeroarchaeum sulfurireducens]